MKRLILIDGNAQIYRAIFTKGARLRSPSGEPTWGTYYFMRMLVALLREQAPTHLMIALDSPRDLLRRREIFPGYKAKRTTHPEEVKVQFERIEQIITMLGIPTVRVPKWEADDVIASAVHKWRKQVDEILIVSRDKDLMQLIRTNVFMYDASKAELVDWRDVQQRWDVRPWHVPHVQALMGDTTDGVPGIQGIGEKRAKELITKYGDLDGVINALNKITGAMGEALYKAHNDGTLHTMKMLVSLNKSLRIPFKLNDLRHKTLDWNRTSRLFHRLGFKQWSRV